MTTLTSVIADTINGIVIVDDFEGLSVLDQDDFYAALSTTQEPIAAMVDDDMLATLKSEYGVR